MKQNCIALVLVALSLTLPAAASAQAIQGFALFEQRCGACHNTPAADTRAPDRLALSQRTPEAILESITTGSMAVNAEGLSDTQKRLLAQELAGRPLGALMSGQASAMKNPCTTKTFSDPSKRPMWSGWGADPGNTRFQPANGSGLSAAQVPKLALRWAFAFPNGSSAFGQPAVARSEGRRVGKE